MANRSFWIFDVGKFKASIANAKLGLEEINLRTKEAVGRALTLLAEDWISAAQQRAKVRSGALRGSADVIGPEFAGTEVSVQFGFNIKYARFRNFGGTIKPVKSKMLAIPLGPVLTGRGVARYNSPLEDLGAPLGMFVVRLWGKVYLAHMIGRGKTARIEFRWLLLPSVTQQGDKFLTGIIEERRNQAPALVAQLVRKELGT